MSTLPTFLYGFNLIPIKVTATCLCQVGVDQSTQKHVKIERIWNRQAGGGGGAIKHRTYALLLSRLAINSTFVAM